jgi:DNA-binding protein H-NS
MDTIEITLPVTHAAAERLREPAERARLGALVSLAIASEATSDELAEAVRLLGGSVDERQSALRAAFADMQRAAEAARIIPAEIKDELAARKRERIAASPGGSSARRR